MAKIDITKYAAQVANAASQVKISSTIFKDFIADVKTVVDGNDDLRIALQAELDAHQETYENHGNMKNKLINGGFLVNERAVSGTVILAAGAYGHNQWKAGASGCTYTFATSLNVTTLTISAGSLLQIIEGTSLFSGTHTLSWTGTVQGKIGAGSYGATGITGTAVGGTNLTIEFNTGTISKVQLEEGGYKTPFEQRSVGLESTLCERYLWFAGTSGTFGGYKAFVYGTNDIYFCINLSTMRTTPTIVNNTETTYWNVRVENGAAPTGFTLSVSSYNKHMLILKATKAAHGYLTSNGVYLCANSALFGFSAEL